MYRTLIAATLALMFVTGCSEGKAHVKGRIVENGQPVSFSANQAAVEFSPIGSDGKADSSKTFTAVVNDDGTFEVLASGGEVPRGNYDITFRSYGKLREKYKDQTLRREVKAGKNDFTIDLAKPEA